MALQVWLPLIKDLTNYGLANVTVTSNAVIQSTTEGKFGASYSFDGSTTWIKTTMPSSIKSLKNTSVCMWIKSTAAIGAGGGIMHDTSNAYACMCLYTSGWQMAAGSSWKYINTGTFANTSVWHHIACTMDDTTIRTYFDGALITEITIATQGVLTDMTSNNFIGLGCDFPGGNEYFTGFINDFRVYDHCLSKREVKEISKGLICHYMLSKPDNANYFVNSNLFNGTFSWSSTNSSSVRVETKDSKKCITGTKGTTDYLVNQNMTNYSYIANSQVTFTISADVYVTETGTFSIGNWISTTQASGWQNMSGSQRWNTTNVLSIGWNHVSATRINGTNQYNGSIITAFAYTGTTFWMTNIKFEFGAKETPWLPNSTDTIYNLLGYNNNIEYDCSGYQNNGTRTNVTTTSDTPRNTSSSVFNGSNSYIACGRGGMVRDEITLSLWAYSDDWSRYTSNECMLSCTEGGGWSVAKNTNGNLTIYMGTGTSSNSYIVVGYALTNMKTGWNYIVSTYDGLSSKLYVNGVMVTSKTQYSTKTPIYYHGSNGIFIGAEAGSGPKTPMSSDKFPGYLSDLRIYATALSDTDILELYNAPINFNKHSVMTQGEFIEK